MGFGECVGMRAMGFQRLRGVRILVGRVGFEPTSDLTERFYRPLASAACIPTHRIWRKVLESNQRRTGPGFALAGRHITALSTFRIWRKIDESNAHPCGSPGVQTQLPTIRRYLPFLSRAVRDQTYLYLMRASCLTATRSAD